MVCDTTGPSTTKNISRQMKSRVKERVSFERLVTEVNFSIVAHGSTVFQHISLVKLLRERGILKQFILIKFYIVSNHHSVCYDHITWNNLSFNIVLAVLICSWKELQSLWIPAGMGCLGTKEFSFPSTRLNSQMVYFVTKVQHSIPYERYIHKTFWELMISWYNSKDVFKYKTQHKISHFINP